MTDNPTPQRPSTLQLLTAFHSSAPRWPGALRAALAILLPGCVALLLGYTNAILLIATGAFAVIYGEGHPYRTRARVIAEAGTLLVIGSATGTLVGTLVFAPGHGHWWLILSALFTVLLATTAAFVQNALRLPPPGGFFIVMVSGGSTMLARSGTHVGEVILWACVGAGTAWILGMAPSLLDKHGPERRVVDTLERAAEDYANADKDHLARHHQAQTALSDAWQSLADAGIVSGGRIINQSQSELVRRTLAAQRSIVRHNLRDDFGAAEALLTDTPNDIDPSRTVIPHSRPTVTYRLYRSAVRNGHAFITAERVFFAGLITALLGVALGLGRPDWGAISVLLILQWGPDRVPGTVRAIHRAAGSVLGVCLFATFHYFGVWGWSLLLALAACQFFAEIFVVKNYAFCVIFSTPLALLMGNSQAPELAPVVGARLAEISLSILFALLALWLYRPASAALNHHRLQIRCYESMGALLGALLTETPQQSLSQRRDLQYELLSERRSIQSVGANQPHRLGEFSNQHEAIQHAGYQLLDFCNLAPDSQPGAADIRQLADKVRMASPQAR